MSSTNGYRAFISYSHQDAAFAARLQRKLENFRGPQRMSVRFPIRPVFLDRSELASGPDLSDVVNAALAESDALIVICSPDAAASRWVNAEVLQFKRLGKSKILPLIIRGEPNAADSKDRCFPEALRFQLGSDGELSQTPTEVLAADMRRSGDGRDALLKLIAGLLEVPFDSLKLRQQRRRMKQALVAACGTTAMLLITAYLGIVAMLAREDAVRKRDQAEKLITFMLGDLRDRLQPVGRLDVLEGVGEQALDYFSSLSESEMTSASTLTRVTALRQIGEVRVAQGFNDQGLIAFNEALELLHESTFRNEPAPLFELGQLNYWIADAYFRQLKLDEAKHHIARYLDISRELVKLAPDNPMFRLELLYAESNLGTLAFRANDMDSARRHFLKALDIGRRLDPDGGYDADTISWLGSIEASVGNLNAAFRWHEQELSIKRAAWSANNDPEQRHSLGRTLLVLADVQHQAGQIQAAVESANESIQIYRNLTGYDSQNFNWSRHLARSLTLYARDSYILGWNSAPEALSLLDRASERMAGITSQTSAETVRVFAGVATERARIELAEGRPEVVDGLLRQPIEVLGSLAEGLDRIRVLPIYARALYLDAEASLALGNESVARARAAAALGILELRNDDNIDVRAYGALLSRIAEHPEADNLLSSIAMTDYRGPAPVPETGSDSWWRSMIR